MIRLGINGFGRIGRVLARIVQDLDNINLVAINDINNDNENINYLFNFDSTYGRLKDKSKIEGNSIINKKSNIKIYHEEEIDKVPWKDENIDVLIDSSGISKNLDLYSNLKGEVQFVIVTNTPDSDKINKYIIYGVNHESFNKKTDFTISSSICDATAIAPVLKIIDDNYSIENAFVTTLHPWLGYQNLLDGPSKSYAVPGTIIDNYALGRSSPMALIPKNTSAVRATCKILKNLEDKIISNSFRVPTNIVSSADITIKVKKDITKEDLSDLLNKFSEEQPNILVNNYEALISTDFIGSDVSVTVDHRFLNVHHNYIKLICWYDNEWGYSSKVIDLVNYISN